MRITRRGILLGTASVGTATLAAPRLGAAQANWPNGPIRIIVAFPPGGSNDTIARLLQPHLQASLGVPIVVENRPGASGALGTAAGPAPRRTGRPSSSSSTRMRSTRRSCRMRATTPGRTSPR